MLDYQREFIEFSLSRQVLKFGEFVLKSGRESPYFFNSGLFNDGESLAKLGEYYARAIISDGLAFDGLYGPAYKGIPLVAATAIALNNHHGRSIPYSFNRKEAKDHGEGGLIVGAPVAERILLIDDVISAGTSVRESVDIIGANGGQVVGVAISLDRQERGQGPKSAVLEVAEHFGLTVIPIVTLALLVEYLQGDAERAQVLERVLDYRNRFGA